MAKGDSHVICERSLTGNRYADSEYMIAIIMIWADLYVLGMVLPAYCKAIVQGTRSC